MKCCEGALSFLSKLGFSFTFNVTNTLAEERDEWNAVGNQMEGSLVKMFKMFIRIQFGTAINNAATFDVKGYSVKVLIFSKGHM